jgi:hydrogenase maturation protease
MNIKMIALGNVLMMDDGIAIFVASELEKELRSRNIDVIYGETDIGYCISSVGKEDYLIILDGASCGKAPGEVTVMPLSCTGGFTDAHTQHNINFLDLLKIYHPDTRGTVFAIEINEVRFHYGLSQALTDKKKSIAQIILNHINHLSCEMTGV